MSARAPAAQGRTVGVLALRRLAGEEIALHGLVAELAAAKVLFRARLGTGSSSGPASGTFALPGPPRDRPAGGCAR